VGPAAGAPHDSAVPEKRTPGRISGGPEITAGVRFRRVFDNAKGGARRAGPAFVRGL